MLQSKARPSLNVTSPDLDDTYFEFQADMGFTKHIGGTKATDELLRLCHVNEQSTILDVGCGVGLTACYIAEKYKARVVGVDVRPKMIERAKGYAKAKGLESFVRFEVADAQVLPLSDNVYDAVICESVLAFIPDQPKALREWMRVAKPGAYVGITEAIWLTPPPESARKQMDSYTGAGSGVQAPEKWISLVHESGLKEIICRQYPVEMLKETGRQIKRVGLIPLLKAWVRAIKLLFTSAKYRRFMSDASKLPKPLLKHMGFGIYVGRVPEQ